MASQFPFPKQDVHKGQRGRIGVIAGSEQMIGAGILAALAAFRTGAGLVCLCSPKKALNNVNSHCPELICCPLDEIENSEVTITQVTEYCRQHRFDTVVIGPGLGRGDALSHSIKHVCLTIDAMGIGGTLDADALMALDVQWCRDNLTSQNWVLTPHPKEFQHLFPDQCTDSTDRVAQAQLASKEVEQVIVLKGYQTVVAGNDRFQINKTGNPGMATAGSGDVLSGIIATLKAQGLSVYDAASLGVYIHGLAGDAAFELMDVGLIASDIIQSLPRVIKSLR